MKEKELTGAVKIRDFYLRRALRIAPLQYFYLAVAVIYGLFVNSAHIHPVALISMLLLVGNWYGGYVELANFGTAYALWSLSVEEQFYLVWPSLCRLLSTRRLILVSALLIPLGALAIVERLYYGPVGLLTIWTNSFVQFQMFGLGALLAISLRGRVPKYPWPVRALCFALSAALFLAAESVFCTRGFTQHETVGQYIGGYLCAGLASLLALVGILGIVLAKWMQPVVYLGKISYGLYVYHALAIDLVNHATDRMAPRIAGYATCTLLFAAISYQWLERPFMRLKERFAVVRSRTP